FENVSAANPATKHSKSSSKPHYDATNNRLPKSVHRIIEADVTGSSETACRLVMTRELCSLEPLDPEAVDTSPE
ncbi:hypothetical protein, partial [Halapricum hydrolyticum]